MFVEKALQKSVLNKWFNANLSNPYATLQQKAQLAQETQLTIEQVTVWLKNKRFRSKKTQI